MLKNMSEKIRVKLQSFNHELLNQSCTKIITSTKTVEVNTVGPIHKRIIDIYYDSTINIMQLLSELDLPAGVLYQVSSSSN